MIMTTSRGAYREARFHLLMALVCLIWSVPVIFTILVSVRSFTDIIEQQGAATQEISRNVQRAAEGTTQVASNIVDVQHGSSETGSASSQVLSSAQSLSLESNRLKLEVQRFLATVSAA